MVRIRPGESGCDHRPASTRSSPPPDQAGRRFPLQTHADLVQGAVHCGRSGPKRSRFSPSAQRGAVTRVVRGRARLGPGPWARPSRPTPTPATRAWTACSEAAVTHRAGSRLQPARSPTTCSASSRCGAVQPAARHHWPVPRRRPPARLRPAAPDQRRARDRGRGRRQRQGLPDGLGADPAGRAPAAEPIRDPQARGSTRAAAPDRHRGGPPAAAPAGTRRRLRRRGGRARGRDVRRACWPRSAPTARG